MKIATFSILLPTIGRPSLARTLASIYTQRLEFGDEVLLAIDANYNAAHATWDAAKLSGKVFSIPNGPHCDWGHTPRNLVMPYATGDYLLSIDDDDSYEPGAFDAIRRALAENPQRPHIFRMRYKGGLLWRDNAVEVGNFSTQQLVIPNDPSKLGKYGSRYEGDYDFMLQTLSLYPQGSVVWREEVIARYRDS